VAKENTRFKSSRDSPWRFYPICHMHCFLSYSGGPGWRGSG